MRVAIVHDWLVTAGGGENVLSEALKAFPGAPVHALIDKMSEEDHARLGIPRARTSWMQHLPGIERSYRSWLAMMPTAMRSIELAEADTVLAISHAVAKAPKVRYNQRLLVLSLSPMRYAWDLKEQYLAEAGLDRGAKGAMARALLGYMQGWDRDSSKRVDAFASISRYIADRVQRAYGRESVVIYPPVDTEYFTPSGVRGGGEEVKGRQGVRGVGEGSATEYYVTASRFVPYKRIDLIVKAFAGDPSRQLVVVGDGPDNAKVRAAGAPNITFVGHAGREELRTLLRGARAFVFAAEEDFGIAPVEAQACGTPVIAYGKGAVLETTIPLGEPNPSGLFFDAQTVESIRAAVARFEANAGAFTAESCRASSERFAAARFRAALAEWVAANSVRQAVRR